MRALLVLVAVLSMLAPSYAHAKGKKGHSDQQTTQKKNKTDDRGYKDALSKLPDQKADPWQGVR